MNLLAVVVVSVAVVAGQGRVMLPEMTDLLSAFEYSKEGGDGWRAVRISSPEEWRLKRDDIRRRVVDIAGRSPAPEPLAPRVIGEEDADSYVRRKVAYAGIPAWLLVPKGIGGRRAAIVAMHQTIEAGKDAVVGLAGKPLDRYGQELAERGFVVLAPDSITAGERVFPGDKPYVTETFYRANPEWSALGKMLADHRRGLDYLGTLDFVDARRIGAIGHSLGGHNAFFLAAFDERVRAAVSSCGFTPLGRASKPFAWSRPTWFIYLPKLAPYLRAGIAPFDFHEVLAMIAPRAFYNYSAAQDRIFPDAEAIRAAADQVAGVYKLLGAADRFVFRMGESPHEFPEAIRREAYSWIEKQLLE